MKNYPQKTCRSPKIQYRHLAKYRKHHDIRRLASKLNNMGNEIENNEMAMYPLNDVHYSFDGLIRALDALRNEERSFIFEFVNSKLINEEQRTKIRMKTSMVKSKAAVQAAHDNSETFPHEIINQSSINLKFLTIYTIENLERDTSFKQARYRIKTELNNIDSGALIYGPYHLYIDCFSRVPVRAIVVSLKRCHKRLAHVDLSGIKRIIYHGLFNE